MSAELMFRCEGVPDDPHETVVVTILSLLKRPAAPVCRVCHREMKQVSSASATNDDWYRRQDV